MEVSRLQGGRGVQGCNTEEPGIKEPEQKSPCITWLTARDFELPHVAKKFDIALYFPI